MFMPLLMYKNNDMPRIAAKHYAVPPAVVNVARPRYASQNITKVSCFLYFSASPAGTSTYSLEV